MLQLNSSEIMALERFNADPVAREAVKKVVLNYIYTQGVLMEGVTDTKNFMLQITDTLGRDYSDEELGRVTRARKIAVELLEDGFKDIEKYKASSPIPEKVIDYR